MQKVNDLINDLDKTALYQSFAAACSDKEFKDFVYGLNIEEETLMKYTSSLEDAFIECKNCKNCKNLSDCKNNEPGYKYTPIKDRNIINFSYVACDKKQKELNDNEYKKYIELFDMPKDIAKASLKDIYKEDKRLPVFKYITEFINSYDNEDKPKGLYLHGSFGSGKTYLIAALFNELAKKKNIRSVLIYYPEFLRSLKASFQTTYTEQFNYIKKVPLLLLDDIGAENCSAWARDEVLGPILQYRMDSHLPTFFTSNLTLEELESSLAMTSTGVDKVKARRIVERIKQLTTDLELISKNRRD